MKKIPLVAVAFAAVAFASAGASRQLQDPVGTRVPRVRSHAGRVTLPESPRELPVEKEVDVLVLGGGSAALSAAVAAAKDALARERKGKVRVAVRAPHGRARSPSAPYEGEGDADTKGFLWGFRPFDRGLAKVGASANALPVLGEYDVVVVGGGTSGGPAVIASARAGAKTLLIEYQYALGGVSTIGMIGKYWYGNKCGFTAELERGVKAMGAGVYVNAKAEWMRREARKGGAEMWFGVMGCGAVVRNGLARSIFEAYAADPRGVWALHARNVLSSAANGRGADD